MSETVSFALQNKEHIEIIDADGKLQLIVSDAHTFGTDALLLASFANVHNGQKVCDFGTGCGIIPFYWLNRCQPKELWAVEIQSLACDQLRRSVALSPPASGLRLLHSDLRDLKEQIPAGSLDVITMNPPYSEQSHGPKSENEARRTARTEMCGTLGEICASAARLLRFGGAFCICLRPERLTDAICAMREAGLEPKRLQLVSQKPTDTPWLFLLEGKRGRKSGLQVMAPLCLQTAEGAISQQLLEIMGSYKK